MPMGIYKRKSKKIPYVCIVCDTVKYAKPSIAKTRKYCSRECYWSIKKSKETKNKTRVSMIGQHAGKNNPMYGKYGKDSARFINEKIQRTDGRWLIWSEKKGKRVFNSRYIVEQCLRRKLTKLEVVHHINEDPSDDRPENLYVFVTNGKHSGYHKLKNKFKLISNLL